MFHIVVIESNTGVRKLISDFLINCGHEVLVAENGKEGLQRCTETVDFVIVALFMPEKDGLEVIMDIKSKWPGIQIIILGNVQGHAPDINLFKMAKMLGASYVLNQPLNLPKLLGVLSRLHMQKKADRKLL